MGQMFGELPNLFDRDFAMAFFLPAIVFIGLVAEIANIFGKGAGLLVSLQSNLIIGATLLGVIAWLLSILLLVTNRELFNVLEGYGRLNPLKVFTKFEMNYYNYLLKETKKLIEEKSNSPETFPADKQAKLDKLEIKKSQRVPDSDEWILPTPFGNTIRAFEVYPRVMYGIEQVDSWSRLLAIIPKDYRELIDNAKSQVDIWANFGILFSLLILEYLGLAFYTNTWPVWWMLILLILVACISPVFGQRAVVEWGNYVKAAFDVFGPQLRESLGFELPKNREEEKSQWTDFSHAIVFRLPERMPELKKQDIPTDSTDSKGSKCFLKRKGK
jgi:hypothetical protein